MFYSSLAVKVRHAVFWDRLLRASFFKPVMFLVNGFVWAQMDLRMAQMESHPPAEMTRTALNKGKSHQLCWISNAPKIIVRSSYEVVSEIVLVMGQLGDFYDWHKKNKTSTLNTSLFLIAFFGVSLLLFCPCEFYIYKKYMAQKLNSAVTPWSTKQTNNTSLILKSLKTNK